MTNATETKIDLKPAARRLVGGFAMIDARWLAAVAEKLDNEDSPTFPAHGYCFVVHDSADRRAIEALMRPFIPEDQAGLLAFIEEKNISIDLEDYLEEPHHMVQLAEMAEDAPVPGPVYDVEELREDTKWKWEEKYDDDMWLAHYGWHYVGDTGVLATEIDGELILGINGGGYDFYEAHWIPLYRELGYGWHNVEA